MFNAALVRVYVALLAVVAKLADLRPAPRYRVGVVGARGITMIEYAIMAAIAIGVGLLFKQQLGAAFNAILSTITTQLGGTGLSTKA